MHALAPTPHLVDDVKAKLRRPNFQLPMLPAVALDVLRLSRTPHVTMEQIEVVLKRDPALTAKVLQQAESPLFGTKKVHSLRDAMVRLGLGKLGDLVMWTAMNSTVFKGGHSQDVETIRQHSAATAYAASVVAKYTPNPPDYAFLCGLLHDVGAVVMLTHQRDRDELPRDIFWNIVHEGHMDVGSAVAIAWKLPNEIEMVIEAHHSVLVQGYPHPLSAIVCLGEELAAFAGYRWPDPEADRSARHVIARAKETLRISDKMWAKIEQEVLEGVANQI